VLTGNNFEWSLDGSSSMCTNGGGESMEAGVVAVESLLTPTDGGKRFHVGQQLLQSHFL
jgi:hypothetical protein